MSPVTLVAQADAQRVAQRVTRPTRGENLAHRGNMRLRIRAGNPLRYIIPEDVVPIFAMAGDPSKGAVLE